MSQINVNTIKNKAGTGAPNFPSGATVTGVVTATSFVGDGSQIEALDGGNITTGTIAAARVATLNQNTTGTAGGLTGTPSITVQDITGVGATFTGNVSIGGTLTYEDVTNVDSVGIVTARLGLRVPDNVYSYFGTGNDLSIRHDQSGGEHSYIFNHGAGVLKIGSDTQFIIGKTSNATYIQANPDSDVKLYFNNSQKLATTNTGAIVTGILTATTFAGRLENVPASNKTAAYTAVKEDAGTIIRTNNASGVTINQNIFASGDIISVYNNSGGNISIVQGTGVTLRLVGTSTTGTRTLALRGLMTVTCVSSNEFVCSGGGLS